MNVRTLIGSRITAARNQLGLSIKELAAKTSHLSAASISNYERGVRIPGLQETQYLADALQVAASYLLGMTDNPQGELPPWFNQNKRMIQVFPLAEAHQVVQRLDSASKTGLDYPTIVLDQFNLNLTRELIFAVTLTDTSMQPKFNPGDLVIVANEKPIKPRDFVLAYLPKKKETVLRQYGETSTGCYQLLASDPLWTNMTVDNQQEAQILGVVIEHRCYLA